MQDNQNLSGRVNSVSKALSILDCFTTSQPFLSLTQISTQLHLPKSTTLNLIRTLESEGFLIKSQESQLYSLGYKILEHSYSLRSSMTPIQAALPFLEDLKQRTSMTIYLTTHYNGRVLYLDAVYPTRRIGAYSTSGRTHPMHCTSCGKAMLATMPESTVDRIITHWGLERRTINTITEANALKKELEITRARGYAIDNEEETSGVRCIASAIRNSNGFPTAAISISGTLVDFTDSKMAEYAIPLLQTCSMLNNMANQFPGNYADV